MIAQTPMIDQVQIFRQLALLEKRFDNLIKPELPLDYSLRALFSAYNSASDANVTGDGTYYTVICDTEIADRNGDYNNGTGIFTAPVDGYYLLIGNILLANVGAAHTKSTIQIITSNHNYSGGVANPAAARSSDNYYTISLCEIADMDAADTAYMRAYVANGAKTVSVFGAAGIFTSFQGYLLI